MTDFFWNVGIIFAFLFALAGIFVVTQDNDEDEDK